VQPVTFSNERGRPCCAATGDGINVSNLAHRTSGRRALEAALVLSCLLLATALRLSFVDSEPLWVDEAESGINALTILERGYPADRYLGLPIYENILLTATPNSEEYEFKDSSYSDRGMAIYHGWLPLYSIAAAYALSGIRPDQDDGGPPTVRHSSQELVRRTVVPRLPAILFALVFLSCSYHLGRTVSGYDTAWSLLMATAFAQSFVWFGWQARYYSATLAFSALSGLAVWNLTRRGRWRDSVAAGLALLLLFHTHSLSFLIVTTLLLTNVPFGSKQPRYLSKLLLTGAVVALGIVPWMYWTGFFDAAAGIPSAWPLLSFPGDFVSWFATRKGFVGIIASVIGLVLLAAARPHHRLSRLAIAAERDRHALYFALTWFVIAYLGFMFLVPAASFFQARLLLVLALPGYLLFALCIAVASRTITPRFAVLVSPLLTLAFLGVRGAATFQSSHLRVDGGTLAFVELASSWKLEAGTKLYAWPNNNLLLTYYSGLPVQSIAPVRKSFLDEYPDDIILLETGTPYAALALKEVQTIGRENGAELSIEEAQQVSGRVQRHGARQHLQGRVANIWPPSEAMTTIDLIVLEHYKERTRLEGQQRAAEYPLLRRFPPLLMMSNQWLPAFYWFVGPEKRIGDQLNYLDRIRSADGLVLPGGSIIFDSRRNRNVPLVDREQYRALMDMRQY
jgi:hypothetical protein